MRRRQRFVWLGCVMAAVNFCVGPALSIGGEARARSGEQEARKLLEEFEHRWREPKGLMPLGDKSWKARAEIRQKLLRVRSGGTTVLLDALQSRKAATRAFAAEVLGLVADTNLQPALIKLLRDEDSCVRLQTIRSLGYLGPLERTAEAVRVVERDPSWLVQAQMGIALSGTVRAEAAALREAIVEYDLKQLGTAHVGAPAPSFTLSDAFGRSYRLADYRGEKVVALVFLALDL